MDKIHRVPSSCNSILSSLVHLGLRWWMCNGTALENAGFTAVHVSQRIGEWLVLVVKLANGFRFESFSRGSTAR